MTHPDPLPPNQKSVTHAPPREVSRPPPSSRSIPRRHDLDALRAIAMLLGIGLHASLSVTPLPAGACPVTDIDRHESFAVAMAAVHGFRMPLFFLISGFFTAMLWRKRGLTALLLNRLKRIALPLFLGMFTIIPAMWVVSIGVSIAASRDAQTVSTSVAGVEDQPNVEEIVIGNLPPWLRENPLLLFLIFFPAFHHLWFLWFLCWLVAAFAVYAKLLERTKLKSFPRLLVISPLRYLWLVPLTMLPQALMGLLYPNFGPDTSTGLVPMPHVLFYYAIFFFFGAMYFDCDDQSGRVGRWWWITVPLSVAVIFPIAYELTLGEWGLRDGWIDPDLHRPSSVLLQVLYVWLMIFGMMGLFRRCLSGESKAMRYVSDSSYWLYLVHLPLIFIAQFLVRNSALPAVIKFGLICVLTSALLLASYQLFVRYTPIGTLLNGPRIRPQPLPAPVVAELVDASSSAGVD